LGKYSYGLYIFHWPIYLLLKPLTNQLTVNFFAEGGKIQLVISSVIASIAGVATSILSYHLFEKHFLKLRNKFYLTL